MKEKVFDTFKDLGKIVGVGAVVTVICSVLMFHVWNRYRITHMGYEIARVTKEHRDLVEQNRKLSIEVAVQGRTERMTEVARARFVRRLRRGTAPRGAVPRFVSAPAPGRAPTARRDYSSASTATIRPHE